MSSAGGHAKAIERAAAIGCNCAQVFSGSPRGWKRAELTTVDVDKISTKQNKLDVSPIFTHALYLINMTADKADTLQKSLTTVSKELEFDAHVGGAGVVIHLGSHLGVGWDGVKADLRDRLHQVLQATPTASRLLIENSAGQNGKLCSDLSEIRWLFDELEKLGGYVSEGRLGWCVDTCHAWAAGYSLGPQPPTEADLAHSSSTNSKNHNHGSLVAAIDTLDLWSTLRVIHVNDSKDPFGSGRDRHENIGEGSIPTEDLRHFLNLTQVSQIPLITEVPGFAGDGPDEENIQRIKELVGSS